MCHASDFSGISCEGGPVADKTLGEIPILDTSCHEELGWLFFTPDILLKSGAEG